VVIDLKVLVRSFTCESLLGLLDALAKVFFSPGLPAFPPNQFFVSGDRLSEEAARRFVFHFISALLSQSANFLKGEESFSNSIFSTGYGDESSLIPFQVPSPTHSCRVLMDCFCT
jgi:hypothetical protein